MEWVMLLIMVAFAVAMTAYAFWPTGGDRASLVARRLLRGETGADAEALARAARDAVRAGLFERAAPMLSKPVMPRSDDEQNTLRIKMAHAGFRRENAPIMFLASKTATAAIGAALALFLTATAGRPLLHVAGIVALAAGAGFLAPNLWLWLAIRRRGDAVRRALPDALDLMVVSVEAGLGLDAALQRVGDEMRNVGPELSEELQVATVETQMGVPRGEALTRMAERTNVQEAKALVAVITQAEKLGTSIAKALRNQAEALRTKRRQQAEERAQKTAVKLLLPLILFIFPAILVVLGGPAGIKLAQTLGDGTVKPG
jgi:tight adherence protein C